MFQPDFIIIFLLVKEILMSAFSMKWIKMFKGILNVFKHLDVNLVRKVTHFEVSDFFHYRVVNLFCKET